MGWSCRKDAGDVLDKIMASCVSMTGISNNWKHNGASYMFEVSSKEHDDGAITGSIYNINGLHQCFKKGSFRIEGSGEVSRGGHGFKELTAEEVKA